MVTMEINIGLQHVSRELSLEVDMDAAEVNAKVSEALANNTLLVLEDSKGKTVTIVPSTLAYITAGNPEVRSVGFARP